MKNKITQQNVTLAETNKHTSISSQQPDLSNKKNTLKCQPAVRDTDAVPLGGDGGRNHHVGVPDSGLSRPNKNKQNEKKENRKQNYSANVTLARTNKLTSTSTQQPLLINSEKTTKLPASCQGHAQFSTPVSRRRSYTKVGVPDSWLTGQQKKINYFTDVTMVSKSRKIR